MTAIRAWNGSEWTTPEFFVGRTSGQIGPELPIWDAYRPIPVDPGVRQYSVAIEEAHITNGAGSDYAAYGFDADAQGWHYQNSGAVTTWRPGAIDMPSDASGYAQNIYSPHLDLGYGPQTGGWMVASCTSFNPASTSYLLLGIMIYIDIIEAHSYSWRIEGTTGPVRYDLPTVKVNRSLDTPYMVITLYGYGHPTPEPQTIIPQYWNGSAWVLQNEV